MAGGVTPPPQTSGHGPHPQAQIRGQSIEQAAFTHSRRAAHHRNAWQAQGLPQGQELVRAELVGNGQGRIPPARHPLTPTPHLTRSDQIGLAEHQLNRTTGALGGEQKTGELEGIDRRFGQGHHHHHPPHIGHGGPLQQAVAGLKRRHGAAASGPINAINAHTIADADALAALAQAGTTGAEQLANPTWPWLVENHPAVIGLQGHHLARTLIQRLGGRRRNIAQAGGPL